MYKKSNPVTRLCTSDVDNIWVRGRNLCDDLIGKINFTDYFWLLVLGEKPSEAQAKMLDACLVAIAEHGGVFLARGGRYVQLEGNDRSRNVVARFPSLEAAVECYNSDKYQAAVGHAKLSSVRDLVVVEEG